MSRRKKQERWVPVPLTYLLSVQEFSHGLGAETHSSPLGKHMGTDMRKKSGQRGEKRLYPRTVRSESIKNRNSIIKGK